MNSLIYMCASYLIFIAVAYACACVFFSHDQTHRPRRIAIILGSAVVAWVLAHALKDVIAHPRPDGSLALLVPNDGYSFPSGHATFMFALAFAMSSFDKRASILLFILALLTGIARVAAGVHFWYDIVGGAVLAFFVATSIIFLSKKYLHKYL